jgi:hypothetical protein
MERRVVTFLPSSEVDDAVCKSTLSRLPHQLFHFYVQLTDGGVTDTTPTSFSIVLPCSPSEQCPVITSRLQQHKTNKQHKNQPLQHTPKIHKNPKIQNSTIIRLKSPDHPQVCCFTRTCHRVPLSYNLDIQSAATFWQPRLYFRVKLYC